MTKLYSLVKQFAVRREGSVSTILGLTFIMVTGASLGAIEIEQMKRARIQMQDKLDATILYLGGSDHKTQPQQAGVEFLNEAIEASKIDVENVDATFTFDAATGAVIGSVDFDAPTILTGGMVPEPEMRVEAVASPKITGRVEIALVLDTSGSMGWSFDQDWQDEVYPNRRIDGLHEAASDMFDVIYENPQAIPAVSVIPYSASVDITDLFAGQTNSERHSGYESLDGNSIETVKMLHGLSIANIGEGSSGPGPYGEANVVDVRDRTHTMGVWVGERYQSQNGDGSYQLSLDPPSGSHKIPVFTEEDSDLYCADWQIQSYGQRCTKWTYDNGWEQGGYQKPNNGILPMTTDSQLVRDYVASFEPDSGTAGHIAAAWGLYALAPEWADVFNHPAGDPAEWDQTTEKYLVFMTDGSFNSQKDPNMDDSEMYKYFQSVCDKARANGVRIFTVGLKLNATTDSYLQACVGDNGKHFPADNRVELVDAFASVGRETGELRLSH